MAEAQRFAGRIAWPDALAELAFRRRSWRAGAASRTRRAGTLATVRAVLGEAEMADSVHAAIMDLYGYLTEDLEEGPRASGRGVRAATAKEHAHPPLIAVVLIGIADLALRQGHYEQAVRLLAASDGVRGMPDRSQPDASRIAAQTRNPPR